MHRFAVGPRFSLACQVRAATFLLVLALSRRGYCLSPPPVTDLDDLFVYNSKGLPHIPDDWRLIVDGAVQHRLILDLEAIRELPALTEMVTLECAIPGGSTLLVGNANWTGVPLRTLIEAAGPLPDAASVRIHAVDLYSLGDVDLATIMSDESLILAYGMNGQTLPLNQGYPLRFVVPGAGGFHWVQWVERIEIKTSEPTYEFEYVPQHVRILAPLHEEAVAVGRRTIRGMAVSGRGREITRVEVSVDAGRTWQEATLLSEFVPYVWKIWEFKWDVSEVGLHRIFARTYDDTGEVQNQHGAYGWWDFFVPVNVEPDSDADGIADSVDLCPEVFNPAQPDRDHPVPDSISFLDFGAFASHWRAQQSVPITGDLNADGAVNPLDLHLFADYWLTECSIGSQPPGQTDQ